MTAADSAPPAFALDSLLSPERCLCRAPGGSRKRVFQTAANLVCADDRRLDPDAVYDALLARERLGSTALGNGIAIPHCRSHACAAAVGGLLSLRDPVDFDAPDGEPVDLLFVLLAPEEARQEHVNILAGLAQLLSNEAFCAGLRSAATAAELHRAAAEFRLPGGDAGRAAG